MLLRRAATVELDWDVRQKSRFDAVDSTGRPLGVFLPRGSVVRGGDVLVAEDGSLIVVRARPQPVMVVRACAEHGSPFDLLRAAYHLGNRHVQLELTPDHLKLEPDHVLGEMLRADAPDRQRGSRPRSSRKRGAYAAGAASHGHGAEAWAWPRACTRDGHGQGHGHGHDHEHDHDHDHDHGHGHSTITARHDRPHGARNAPRRVATGRRTGSAPLRCCA